MPEPVSLDPALRAALEALDERAAREWVAGLDARKRAEAELHDEHREVIGSDGDADRYREYANSKFYKTTGQSKRFIRRWLERNARDRVVLDFACGNGVFGFRALQAGAAFVVGIDLSTVSIDNARRHAERQGWSDRSWWVAADCEQTGLPDESVDVVLCGGVLHHLELEHALPEIRRVLRPGGYLFAVEPLDYNPVFKLYRRLTPGLRTEFEAEHILSFADIRLISRFFMIEKIHYFHLFSLLSALLHRSPLFKLVLKAGDGVDHVVTRLPLIKYLSWQFCLVAQRAAD